MSSGKVFINAISGIGDHVVIPNARTDVRWKFDAGQWTELRIALFLSLTKTSGGMHPDEDPTGLAETISAGVNPYDFYWIGLKSDGPAFPFAGASQFVGFTNSFGQGSIDSKLVSSDIGLGTSNAYFWRGTSGLLDPTLPHGFCGLRAVENGINRLAISPGWEQHFPQDNTNAGGYSVCLGFRLRRNTPQATVFTVDVNANATDDCALAYSNTTNESELLATLEAWPTSIRTSPQIVFSAMPTTIFIYWPFTLSRLRVSSRGMLRFR